MNNIKFKSLKISKKADLKLKFKLYYLISAKYLKRFKFRIQIISSISVVLMFGLFIFYIFIPHGGEVIDTGISESNIALSKSYRDKRHALYVKTVSENRIVVMKTNQLKEVSFKRKIVSN